MKYPESDECHGRSRIISCSAIKSSKSLTVFLAGIVCFCFTVLQAQLINVDFNQNNGVGWGGGGPNPGPTMSGAAVFGSAGDQWNGINATMATGFL